MSDVSATELEEANAMRRENGAAGGAAASASADTRVPSGQIDWSTFWADEEPADWLVEPVLAAGRGHSLAADHKTGKSLFALWLAVMLALGRPVLRRPAGPRVSVLLIDWEMSRPDVIERLGDMGIGPEDDLTHLAYYLHSDIEPLDSPNGARQLKRLLEVHRPELVILDTFGRAVRGPEDEADTVRAFYTHAGLEVKRFGAASLRLDHLGHGEKGRARGSSAKGDDVDVLTTMQSVDGGFGLKSTARMAWFPDETDIAQHQDPLRYSVPPALWPAGTAEAAGDLDKLGVDLGATVTGAQAALSRAGKGRRKKVVAAALRWRREQQDRP